MLNKFGLELRKIGDIKNLYKDVDLILEQSGIPKLSVNSDVQSQTVAHALQKMFKVDSWLDVCAIQECASLCQIVIPIERMRVYRSIHCVKWNEMLPDYRIKITAMILDDFRSVLYG